MIYETVIFPNPNQFILLRQIQKKLPGCPVFPLCLRCHAIKSIKDKVTEPEITGISQDEESIFITASLTVNGRQEEGRIDFANFFDRSQGLSVREITEAEENLLATIKKISPFRLVNIEINKNEKGSQWNITEEKWQK